jgi:hypothetical protein
VSIFNFNTNIPSETFPTGSVTILPDYSNVNNAINNADFNPLEQKTTNLQTLTFPLLSIDFGSKKGWSMFAFTGLEPINTVEYFNLITNNVEEDVEVVKDSSGNVYWPQYSLNGIGDLKPGQGYQIRLKKSPSLFNLTPNVLNFLNSPPNNFQEYLNLLNAPSTTLVEGWNLIGFNRFGTGLSIPEILYQSFFPDYPLPSLSQIHIDLDRIITIAKNNNGDVYYPYYGFNGLGNLTPGQGYQIKTHNGFYPDGTSFNFPFEFKFPPSVRTIDPRPLIDGGPR